MGLGVLVLLLTVWVRSFVPGHYGRGTVGLCGRGVRVVFRCCVVVGVVLSAVVVVVVTVVLGVVVVVVGESVVRDVLTSVGCEL